MCSSFTADLSSVGLSVSFVVTGNQCLFFFFLELDSRVARRETVNWIHLAQDRCQWRAVLTVVILRIPHKAGNFLPSCETVHSDIAAPGSYLALLFFYKF